MSPLYPGTLQYFVLFSRMNLVEVVFNFITLAMVSKRKSRHAIGLMFHFFFKVGMGGTEDSWLASAHS